MRCSLSVENNKPCCQQDSIEFSDSRLDQPTAVLKPSDRIVAQEQTNRLKKYSID